MLLHGLSEMHKNLALLHILEIVRDSYEADAVVLFHKLFVDRRKYVGLMFNYMDVSFRLSGYSTDTMIAWLIDELEVLRSTVAMNGTLSTKLTLLLRIYSFVCRKIQ